MLRLSYDFILFLLSFVKSLQLLAEEVDRLIFELLTRSGTDGMRHFDRSIAYVAAMG